jgi:hypothetical protein
MILRERAYKFWSETLKTIRVGRHGSGLEESIKMVRGCIDEVQ